VLLGGFRGIALVLDIEKDRMDAVGRVTQDAKAEDEGIKGINVLFYLHPLTPTLSRRERDFMEQAEEVSSRFTAHDSLLTVYCSLLTAHCSLFTVHCSLFTVHCSRLLFRCG
jgi:hypothetical protein